VVTTAAVVGTAALVSNMAGGRRNGGQQQQQCQGGTTTVIVQQPHTQGVAPGSPAPPAGLVYIYVLCASGFYLTEEGEKNVRGRQPLDPELSVWQEQHVGNGYYVLRSHHGRLLSVKNQPKLSKIATPVKQKCMFFREVLQNQQTRYRAVNGNYLSIVYGGQVKAESHPSTDSYFTLQLVPVAEPSFSPAPQQPPPPAHPVVTREVPGTDDVTNQKSVSNDWYSQYVVPPTNTPSSDLYSSQPAFVDQPHLGDPTAYSAPQYSSQSALPPTQGGSSSSLYNW